MRVNLQHLPRAKAKSIVQHVLQVTGGKWWPIIVG